jgi:hypothetical protein
MSSIKSRIKTPKSFQQRPPFPYRHINQKHHPTLYSSVYLYLSTTRSLGWECSYLEGIPDSMSIVEQVFSRVKRRQWRIGPAKLSVPLSLRRR